MSTETTRLLHVATSPLSLVFLRGQIRYLQEHGFEITAVTGPGPELARFSEEFGVQTFAVEMPRRITPFRDLLSLLRLIGIVRRVRPDIVHGHTPKGGLLAMLAACVTAVPLRIYHIRGLPHMAATGVRRHLLQWTERISCACATRVLCVSRSMERIAIEEGLCPEERIAVLASGSGQGVDVARFDPLQSTPLRSGARSRLGIPADALVVGYVGRIVRDKGICELASAWSNLREKHPTVRLLLVGPFEPQDPLPADVEANLRRDPRVHITGLDWDTPPLYAAMDVVVLPSYREGFPNVPLEAAAMEIPVVSTTVPGCTDAVENGVTGTLIAGHDAQALGQAISAYLLDPALRQEHGRNGRERVLRLFRHEIVRAALLDEYTRLRHATWQSA